MLAQGLDWQGKGEMQNNGGGGVGYSKPIQEMTRGEANRVIVGTEDKG